MWWCSLDSDVSHVYLLVLAKAKLREHVCVALVVFFWCVLEFLFDCYLITWADSGTVSEWSVGQGWLHVYPDKNGIIFCLFTEVGQKLPQVMDARLQNLCASMCPCVTEWSTSAAALVINVETTWEYLPSWWTASPHEVACVCFFHPSDLHTFSDPQQRSRLIVSCMRSKRHCVY